MHEGLENFDEIEEFRKKRRRGFVLTGIAVVSLIAGVSSGAAYACGKWEETRKGIITTIQEDNALKAEEAARKKAEIMDSIEQIVSELKNPDEAYLKIGMDITFYPKYDDMFDGGERWSSLEETYSTMSGDCEDGAIAFAAMLSDNPEYEVKLVYLKGNPLFSQLDHMIAVYQEKQLGTWGYVSFNEWADIDKTVSPAVGFSRMENPLFGSIDSAVRAYCDESFVSYNIFDFTADDLKFGINLNREFDSSAAIQLR